MKNYYELLAKDIRFEEGAKACIKCGTCTAICPAVSFYKYEPRTIVDIVLSRDNEKIEELLKGEMIWYCGECMSCKTRCPRGNVPGLVIMALRSLSQDLGFFVESEKGRQQLFLKRTIGEWTLKYGYCVYGYHLNTDMFPEQGPIWDWIIKNYEDVMDRAGANFNKLGAGAMRKIDDETLAELYQIFDITGGNSRFDKIESASKIQATKMNLQFDETHDCEYFKYIYEANSGNHNK